MRLLLFFVFACATVIQISAQNSPRPTSQQTLTVHPDPVTGKDAIINSYSINNTQNRNFANNVQFAAHSGTQNSIPFIVRGLIFFDFSSIPSGMKIDSAFLSLYSVDRNYGLFMHRNTDGPNAESIRRVTSPWSEATVTWNNAPSTTSINQVALAPSTSSTQDYVNINVTNLISDIHNSTTNYGMLFRQQIESNYRSLNFFSSVAPDSLKRPKLVVHYSPIATNINTASLRNTFSMAPNPAADFFKIKLHSDETVSVTIYNPQGQLVADYLKHNSTDEIPLDHLESGIYFVTVVQNDNSITKKIIVEYTN